MTMNWIFSSPFWTGEDLIPNLEEYSKEKLIKGT
jgi:hypothetical protein